MMIFKYGIVGLLLGLAAIAPSFLAVVYLVIGFIGGGAYVFGAYLEAQKEDSKG